MSYHLMNGTCEWCGNLVECGSHGIGWIKFYPANMNDRSRCHSAGKNQKQFESMNHPIRLMSLDDYDQAYRLWSGAEGLSLREDDTREGIALYLARNPKSCFVAMDGMEVVGVVLSGHDGRRGILRHLAVRSEYRKRGIAVSLVQACLRALAAEGIKKCNIFVMDDNPAGLKFWEHIGFYRLADNYRTLQHGTF